MAATAVPGYRTTHTVSRPDRAGEHRGDMEGTTHAATGFLAGLGFGVLVHVGSGLPAGAAAGQDVLFGLVTAGMALLPDADHPKASFAHAAGGISHGISHLVTTLMGGHRQGMHSVVGVVLLTLVTASCADWWPNKWSLAGLALLVAICTAAGLRATGFLRRRGEAFIAGSAVAAASVYFIRADLWWLVMLGMALHIFEDEFTGHGCALAWPFTSRRFGGDGRQPAARRPVSPRPSRRPAERGPDQPRTRTGPVPSRPMCLQCIVGECGECTDRGCGCPQRVHPVRPVRKRKATVPPEQPDGPGITVEWSDDVPPF